MDTTLTLNQSDIVNRLKSVAPDGLLFNIGLAEHLLDQRTTGEYESETDVYVNTDPLEMGDTMALDGILHIFLKHLISLIKDFGIILIDEIDIENFNDIVNLAISLDVLDGVPFTELPLIDSTLSNPDLDKEEKLNIILVNINPLLDTHIAPKYIKSISDKLFTVLEEKVKLREEDLNNLGGDEEVQVGAIAEKVAIFLQENTSEHIPDILLSLLLDEKIYSAILVSTDSVITTLINKLNLLLPEYQDDIDKTRKLLVTTCLDIEAVLTISINDDDNDLGNIVLEAKEALTPLMEKYTDTFKLINIDEILDSNFKLLLSSSFMNYVKYLGGKYGKETER